MAEITLLNDSIAFAPSGATTAPQHAVPAATASPRAVAAELISRLRGSRDPSRAAEMLRLHQAEGFSAAMIGKQFGVSPTRVRQVLEAAGLQSMRRSDRSGSIAIGPSNVRDHVFYDQDTGLLSTRAAVDRPWRLAQRLTPKGYLRVQVDGRSYYVHRLAWLFATGAWPTDQIDHINGIRNDNRLSNLRDVSCCTNVQNRHRPRAGTATGLLGVHRAKSRYISSICVHGRVIRLGSFSTAEEARAAYLAKKRLVHPGFSG